MSMVEFTGPTRSHSIAVDVRTLESLTWLGVIGLVAAATVIEAIALISGDDSQFGLYPIFSLEYSQNLPTTVLSGLFAASAMCSLLLAASSSNRRRESMKWLGVFVACSCLALGSFTKLAGIVGHHWSILVHAGGFETLLLGHPVAAALAIVCLTLLTVFSLVTCCLAALDMADARFTEYGRPCGAGAMLLAAAFLRWLHNTFAEADTSSLADALQCATDLTVTGLCLLGAALLLSAMLRIAAARHMTVCVGAS